MPRSRTHSWPSCGRWKSGRPIMTALQPEPHLALIVEDDPDVRALAGALLEETPLLVVEVESAEAALDCLQERGGEVAMMFADVRLPGEMDGVQLAKAACTLWPRPRARSGTQSGSGSRRAIRVS